MQVIKFLKLDVDVKTPLYATTEAAGMDLYCNKYTVIPAGNTVAISTGIALHLPQGTYGRIAGRSSISLQNLHVSGGVIDSDYRGEIFIIMFNNNLAGELEIVQGTKIGQLIVEQICQPQPQLQEVNKFSTPTSKDMRGSQGFGSTDTVIL